MVSHESTHTVPWTNLYKKSIQVANQVPLHVCQNVISSSHFSVVLKKGEYKIQEKEMNHELVSNMFLLRSYWTFFEYFYLIVFTIGLSELHITTSPTAKTTSLGIADQC